MKLRIEPTKHKWRFALIVANLAVVVAMLVSLAAGQTRTLGDFLRGLAYGMVFANLTTAVGVLTIGAALQNRVRHHWNALPVTIAGIIIVVPLGYLGASWLLVVLHLASTLNFWPRYWSSLASVIPLAVVFGLGAFAYAALFTRLERAEQVLREKELAEERINKLAAETRLRALESWIHPHFLFNTLNSISALIAVDPARAEQIVGRFANLLRSSLDTSNRSVIPLDQELALVGNYLDIERVRLGARLRANIEITGKDSGALVPSMSIQSLVENAIKHGINPQPEGGEVLVTTREDNEFVIVAVRDSGQGFNLDALPADHGLDKLVQRLDALFAGKAGIRVSRENRFCVVEMIVPRA